MLRRPLLLAMMTVALTGDAPPREFQLLKSGWNRTENGDRLFDEKAARDVMAAYNRHGVRRSIDLEHLSIDNESPNYDPDARGYFSLELRDDGSLWAVDVRWTSDGERRVREGTQAYISPAFLYDAKSNRIGYLVNAALTSMPATHGAQPLMAASLSARDGRRRSRLGLASVGVSFDAVQSALTAALKDLFPSADPMSCDGPWVCDVFDSTAVYQYDGKLYEIAYTFDGSKATLGASPVEVKRTYSPVQVPAAAGAKLVTALSNLSRAARALPRTTMKESRAS